MVATLSPPVRSRYQVPRRAARGHVLARRQRRASRTAAGQGCRSHVSVPGTETWPRGSLRKGVVAKDGVHTLHLVDDLRHAEVDCDARECERMLACEAVLAFHEVEHRRHAVLRGEIEILVEAEGEPGVFHARD